MYFGFLLLTSPQKPAFLNSNSILASPSFSFFRLKKKSPDHRLLLNKVNLFDVYLIFDFYLTFKDRETRQSSSL